MRLSSQNNQLIFNFPADFISDRLSKQFQVLMEKNFIPYESVLEYLNSTVKEIVFPSVQYETHEQRKKRGKVINYKDSKNVFDTFTNEIDITFRSVDSHLNYFMLLEILNDFYLNTQNLAIPFFSISVLDKDGTLIYTILFQQVILRSMGELRLAYQQFDIDEKAFTITMKFNWPDVIWELGDDSKSIFDVPIFWKPGKLDHKYGNYFPDDYETY